MGIRRIENRQEYEKHWTDSQSNLLQSWEWGIIKSPDWQAIRYIIDEKYPVQILIKKLLKGFLSIGYIPRYRVDDSNQIGLFEIAKLEKIDLLLVDPSADSEIGAVDPNWLNDYQIQPQFTNIVELKDKKGEELQAALDSGYRRNINKAKRQNLTVELGTSEKLIGDFLSVMESISETTNMVVASENYYRKVINELSRNNKLKLYVAYINEGQVPVGAYLVVNDLVTASELYGGVTPQGRNYEAGYLLKWEAINHSAQIGLSYYDHWGIADFVHTNEGKIHYNPNHPLFNISKFKAGFGGMPIKLPPQLIYSTSSYKLITYRLLNKVKSLWLRVRLVLPI